MRNLLAVTTLFAALTSGGKMQTQTVKESAAVKITPIIFVDAIEPTLKFWVDRLGFTKTVEVPEGDKLAFVILVKGGAELMIQSRSSVKSDDPSKMEYTHASACLYIEVSDFGDLLKRVDGFEVATPQRDTFYGMREIGVKEPGGNIVTFAAPIKK
jgi:uncharacterized glyoxalase superfamily protein PhnB